MSDQNVNVVRVLHFPPGEGKAYWVYGDKDIIKLGGEQTGGRLAVVETIVPPHGGPPPHIHHGEDEALFIVDGHFEILDNDRTLTAGPGSFVYLPLGSLHYFKNLHDEPKRVYILLFPAGFEHYFYEVGQPVEEGQTESPIGTTVDLARIMPIAQKYRMDIVEGPRGQ